MASSTISSGNLTTRFQNEVKREFVRGGRFGPNTGTDINSIIQVNRNLKKVSIALVAKLSGEGVTGSAQLTGSEETLSNFDFVMQPTYKRNGVLIDNEENELAEFDLFSEARPALMNWAMEKKRDEIIQAMGAVVAGTDYANYGGTVGAFGAIASTAAQNDTWNTNNQDRIVYGEDLANNSSGNHTTSLANITVATGKMDFSMVKLLKRTAENADPLIRPVMIKSDEPWFVLYLGTFAFRDLQNDLETLHSDAQPRNDSNPLWSGGDLSLDGVIVKKVPEIDSLFIDGTTGPFGGKWGAGAASGDGLDNGGDSGSRLSVGFFCGAQAVGFGLGRLPSFKRRKEDDYEHQNGVGISFKHDIKKTFYNTKQHGIVTSFHNAAGD
ncbi:MAG: DUF4043 family protein [Betaproteobacteria bacterium]|nr:DUF4043 family protein [Betaproteobacteria bacterium]